MVPIFIFDGVTLQTSPSWVWMFDDNVTSPTIFVRVTARPNFVIFYMLLGAATSWTANISGFVTVGNHETFSLTIFTNCQKSIVNFLPLSWMIINLKLVIESFLSLGHVMLCILLKANGISYFALALGDFQIDYEDFLVLFCQFISFVEKLVNIC